MKKLLKIVLLFVVIAIAAIYITGNSHVIVAVQNTYLKGQKGPSIDDYDFFYHRRIASTPGKDWPHSKKATALAPEDEAWLKSCETATFMVIHQDSILAETYFDPYLAEFLPNTFSVAKSLVSMSIGVLVKDGKIDLDDPASDYIAELKDKKYPGITIRELLQMASGIDFDENYKNPFGYQAKVYYGKNIEKNTLAFDSALPPGEEWSYAGGNTVLLAMIVEKVSGQKLSHFFAENIWQPIGAQADAWWTVDADVDGTERSSCCFYATTADLARLGSLYLHGGKWGNKQVIPEWYVRESVTPIQIPDNEGAAVMHYGYQWWLGNHKGDRFFQAQGMLGQYIIVVPSKQLVIVRTGHSRSDERTNGLPNDCYRYIQIAKDLLP